MPKRTRSRSRSRVDFSRAVKTARRTGTISSISSARRARAYYKLRPSTVAQRVNQLYSMMETKEISRRTGDNVAMLHNRITLVTDSAGNPFNIFQSALGVNDPMGSNAGDHIGDQISVKGVMIKGFLENALAWPKVYYRVMLLRGAKGDTFDTTNIFKGSCANKMIDQVNTERFTIIAQKVMNISASNVAASGAEVPSGAPIIATAGGIGSRTFKMWIPGYKFGRNGNLRYENLSTSQIKFYDYRLCICVYAWYGSPETNQVGRINQLYSKVYFKDA